MKEAQKEKLKRVKSEVTKNVAEYYETYKDPIIYQDLIRPVATSINILGLIPSDVLDALQKEGKVRVLRSPFNKRYVYPGEVVTEENLEDFLQVIIQKDKTNLKIKKAKQKEKK